jgi:hypothetical protein
VQFVRVRPVSGGLPPNAIHWKQQYIRRVCAQQAGIDR